MPARKRARSSGGSQTQSQSQSQAVRRRNRSRSRARSKRVVVPRDKLGFATSMVSTLRYSTRVEFTPTGITTQALTFRANDMYDPEAAVGGGQPRGFDQMMELYNNYTVTDSKIMVNWMYEGYDGPSTKATLGNYIQGKADIDDCPALSPVICGIMRSADGYGSGVDVQRQMERDRTSWVVLTPNSGAKVSTAKAQLSDFFGKQDLVAADGYSGTANAGPDNQAVFHVWAARGSNDYPADTVKVVAFITMEFRATFTEPKPLQEDS